MQGIEPLKVIVYNYELDLTFLRRESVDRNTKGTRTMSILMEEAAKGHKKSMTTLYQENKGKVFGFCSILLNDKEKAATVTTEVMNGVWGVLAEKGVLSEKKFHDVLFMDAAKQCAALLNIKETPCGKATVKPGLNKVYAGDVKSAAATVQDALKEMDAYQRYIYLLVNAGGMDIAELARVLKQKENTAKSDYEASASRLAEILTKKNAGITVEEVKSLLEQAMKLEEVPKSVDTACKAKIKECAKRPTLSKKLIPVLALIAVCIVIVLAVGVVELVQTAKEEKLAKTAEEYGIELLMDKENATYYADLYIENYGRVTIEIDQDEAPLTAASFVYNAVEGYYDGLTFHSIIDGFMMKGGDPNGDGTGYFDTTIPGEFSKNGYKNDISHTRGTVSMARSEDYNSASAQFFIMQGDDTSLDGEYAAFGHVIEGMDIVDEICAAANPIDDNGTIAAEEQPVITVIGVRFQPHE